jgi:lauroyl/myristoyl acyltransferase
MSPPLAIERSGDRRADAAALTRRMGEEFERAIAAAPADWHMFQPAWED